MKALRKEFWMEVRKSKARFISIFFIVALGVAFFSGIQATSPDMRFSGDAYYDETDLMDIKVMGTMGLNDADVDALKEIEGVQDAEGAYGVDVLCGVNEAQKVLHVESMNQTVNQFTLTEGRAPEKRGELFLDKAFAEGQKYQLGDTMLFREDGDNELLKTKKYTIVGIGTSPLYISFNRGNTTLGSGEVNGFAYVLPENFDQEIYTQIYLRVHGAEGLTSYTDGYENLVDKIKDRVEGIQDVRCQARYDEVVADAQEELDDAKKELADGKKEAEEELADAKKKLDDGAKELKDGKKEYKDGKKQLDDAKKELEDGKKQLADAKEKAADGWAEIADAKARTADAREQLDAAKKELAAGWEELNASQKKIDDGYAKLNEAKAQLADGQAQIDGARAALDEKQAELNSSAAEIAAGKTQIASAREELNTKKQQCLDGLAQVEQGEAAVPAAEAALEVAKGQAAMLLTAYESALSAYEAAVNAGEASEEELAALKVQADALGQQYEGAKVQVDTNAAELEATKQQLAATRTQLTDGLAQVEAGFGALDTKEAELVNGESQLSSGQTQIDAGYRKLEKEEKKLAPARKKIRKSQKELEEGQAEIDAGAKKLNDGQVEIDTNEAALVSAEEEIAAGEAELVSGEQQIAENEQKLLDGGKEIAENEQKLADAKKDIEDGQKELKDGWKEYRKGKKEAEEEIAENEQKLADAQKELDDLEVPEWMVTDRNSLPEYSDYGDNADRIRNIGQVFPVIFFLVAALISLTTMTRMVEEQRTQIGTLKALGYGKSAIAAKYLCYAFLATVGGSILGTLVGEKILPYIIITAYGIMYHNMASNLMIHYEYKFALIASIAAVVCTVGATLFSCAKELRETPASLMRPPAPKEGKRVLIERITFLWKHLSFTWKSTLRNLFRYKKRLLMTVFGIAGSMGLMLVGYGIQDSIMDIAVRQYETLQHYDGTVIEDEDATDAEKAEVLSFMEENEKIAHCTRVQLTKMNAPRGNSNLSVYVYVPENMDNFKEDVTLQNRITKKGYTLNDNGAAICEKTASLLELKVGDTITVEKGGHEYEVKVDIITENYMGHYIYMTPAVYEKTFGVPPDYENIVFTMKEEYQADLEKVGKEALVYPGALSISYTRSLAGQLERMLSTLGTVILVLIISAGMLAFVVLYNLNNINITERKRELATLKVLGFFDMEVSEYVFRENIILTVIGVICGAGFGILLHRYVITTVEVDAVMFGRNINPISFLYSGLFTCGFSLVVNLFMHFKLKKIDMVESLKSVE